MSNDNFGGNRSKYRKVYAYGSNRRPDIRTFVDSVTDTTRSFDFQKIIRDRDFFLIDGQPILTFPTGTFQYWESTHNISTYSEYLDVFFPGPFDGNPIIGFTVYPEGVTSSGSNVAYWATDVSNTGFRANFSGPFSGTLLYRAVYNPGTYPIYVERASGSGNYAWVSAATSSYTESSSATMTFATLPGTPESVLSNPTGISSDEELAVAHVYSDVKPFQISTEFSSPFTGVMDVVAISTVPTGSPQPVDPP